MSAKQLLDFEIQREAWTELNSSPPRSWSLHKAEGASVDLGWQHVVAALVAVPCFPEHVSVCIWLLKIISVDVFDQTHHVKSNVALIYNFVTDADRLV